jgi:hypothetical protein
MRMVQDRNAYQVTLDDLADVVYGALTPEATRDLLLGLRVSPVCAGLDGVAYRACRIRNERSDARQLQWPPLIPGRSIRS